ncbi:MAG: DUF481 domain-containing protein [Bryobacteraceae bacterium]|nr:DUF481 domain-containing protein [Bryobacteraceae bacterium]
MSFRQLPLVALLALALTAPAVADQITFANGDRITGSVVKSDGKVLVLQSEYAGTITVPWDAVVEIVSSAPLNFGLQDGQKLFGTVKGSLEGFEIMSQDAGLIRTTKEAIQYIRSEAEEAAAQRYVNPSLIDLWAGSLSLGYSSTQGNADTSTVNVNASAVRETLRDKITLHFTSLYASNNTLGPSVVTANAIRGGFAYNINISPRLFVFGSTDMEFDRFQDLDLRIAPAAGFGYKLMDRSATKLELKGGGSMNREFFATGLNRTSGEILLGEELSHALSERTSVKQMMTVYPNFTRTGSYRINFDASTETALWKWLGWQAAISSRYLSNPVPGRKKNDLIFTTGFRISFAK